MTVLVPTTVGTDDGDSDEEVDDSDSGSHDHGFRGRALQKVRMREGSRIAQKLPHYFPSASVQPGAWWPRGICRSHEPTLSAAFGAVRYVVTWQNRSTARPRLHMQFARAGRARGAIQIAARGARGRARGARLSFLDKVLLPRLC